MPAGRCFALAVRELSLAARRRCQCQSAPLLLSIGRDRKVTTQFIPDPTVSLWSLACPTPRVCLATGADTGHPSLMVRTDDAGRSWKIRDLASGNPTIDQLDCPDVSHCVAIGDTGRPNGRSPVQAVILASTDGG